MMTKIAVTGEIEIVFTHKECGYQEVLETFDDAFWIDVVTYNLSSHDGRLLKMLRDLPKHVDVRIITNLPNRFPRYHREHFRSKLKTMLANYRALLDPERFAAQTASFFNVSNHSKIVMTDKLAYIGSANFSSESADHYECGVLFKSQNVIERIRECIVDQIVEFSAPHDLSQIAEAKFLVLRVRNQLKELVLSLKEGFYAPLDDMGEGPEAFRWQDAEISEDLLAQFSGFIDEVENGLAAYEDHPQLAILTTLIDGGELSAMRALVEDQESPLVKVAQWDFAASIDKHFQKYVYEAYDEKVDRYMEIANNDADEERTALLAEAKKSVSLLAKQTISFLEKTKQSLAELQKLEETKWGVDNA